ncbi:AIM24 family protein [Millisia brevis]|uniref:AIM24 family protein n=1 Tax=Millisia brevis TaxID=264148 RepID=UPI000831D702|nr:AIM24 family protein [Millisia brevis]
MVFEKVNSKVVSVDVARAGGVVARKGAMLFYQGDLQFSPHQVPGLGQGGGGGGLIRMATRMMQGEHEATMLAQGHGAVHYGLAGLEVHPIEVVPGAVLTIEMSRLLAHTAGLGSSVVSVNSSGGGGGGGLGGLLRGAAQGMSSGTGFFTTQLQGHGAAVLLGHGGVFEVTVGNHPVVVDPQAFVGTYGNVTTRLSAAIGWRDAVGRGSGEAMQLQCAGQGVVFVQASEEKL